MMPSSILWQNAAKTVVLLDLPRSIEEAQVPSSQLTAGHVEAPQRPRRLISAPPLASPFPTPEPKEGGSRLPPAPPSAQVAELMTTAAVESALEEIKASYSGPWCLPRLCSQPGPRTQTGPRVMPSSPPPPPSSAAAAVAAGPAAAAVTDGDEDRLLEPSDSHHLPPYSRPLLGTIESLRPTFLSTAPQFNLIVLDPPWPNRSAKRKRSGAGAYQPARDLDSIRALLAQVPVAAHLAAGGLVAVWVTNAAGAADLLQQQQQQHRGLGYGSVFDEWGVEPVGEWTWLKVTAGGEPVVGVRSAWRKPWERLLIARKKGARGGGGGGAVRPKVIVSVPDVHSRKPNLRRLFEEEEGLLPERYEALEVFARNLTAGWWAWGDEVLLFQRKECWVEEEGDGELADPAAGTVLECGS